MDNQDRALREAIPLESPGANIATHVNPETPISEQQVNQTCEPEGHVLAQFVKKASVPDSIVCCQQIQEDNASLQVLLKTAFDIAGQGSNLVAGTSVFPETGLIWAEDAFYSW